MIFIDPDEIESRIPQELKDKLSSATEDLRNTPEKERLAFINRKADLWRELSPFLATVTSKNKDPENPDYKCWYCEVKTSRFDYHVDHFRPKGRIKDKNRKPEQGYWWLAFEFRNYRLSCAFCNAPHKDNKDSEARGKWDQFPIKEGTLRANNPAAYLDEEVPLLIDPTKPSEVILLSFEDTGKARPKTQDEKSHAYQMVDMSIKVLNLNQKRIVDARKQVWKSCQDKVDDGNKQFRRWHDKGSPVAKEKFERICQDIIDMTRPWSEFSAMTKACFIGTGQDWVIRLILS